MIDTRLQLIRVSDEQVVLKRGANELLVSGSDVASVVDIVFDIIRQSTHYDEIIEASPDSIRPIVEQLISAMRARRLIDVASTPPPAGADAAQWALFESLNADPGAALDRLGNARLTVYGLNRISLSMVDSLLEVGLGAVRAHRRPELDEPEAIDRCAADRDPVVHSGRLSIEPDVDALPGPADLVVATAASGTAATLLGVNRRTVASGVPFLPVWSEASSAFVGPLVIPRETACLRCFADRRPAPGQASGGGAGRGAGPEPPAAVLGRVTAMEVLKFLTACAPSGVVGRSLAMDPAGAMRARRVFKVPRCPDCGELARRRVPSVLAGPQIPNR